MTISSSLSCSLFAFIQETIQKTTAFQIIYQLTVYEFDDIYDKEIAKKYKKHEIQRLSLKEKIEKETLDAVGRPFKLDLKNRFLMLLVYYRLYIIYTLAGFLFNLDQSNIYQRYSKD